MLTQIRYNVVMLSREPGVLIWVLAFPILLAAIFMAMFGGDVSGQAAHTVEVGIVADDAWDAEPALDEMIASLATGDEPLLAISTFTSEEDARASLHEGDLCAYLTVSVEGTPSLHVSNQDTGSIDQAIVQTVLDRYVQTRATIEGLVAADPSALASPADHELFAHLVAEDGELTQRANVLRSKTSEFSRYYYVMLGFSCLMGSQVSLMLVERTRANASPVGARRQASATNPVCQLMAALLSSWIAVTVCMVIAWAFIRFVAGIPFGGRDGLSLVTCGICSLVSCGLGAAIGALPRLAIGAKDGIVTLLTMGLSLPAGLFGQPALAFADWLSVHLPAAQLVNPATQAADAFLGLAYYDSLAPWTQAVCLLGLHALFLLALAALLMRRQSYARL